MNKNGVNSTTAWKPSIIQKGDKTRTKQTDYFYKCQGVQSAFAIKSLHLHWYYININTQQCTNNEMWCWYNLTNKTSRSSSKSSSVLAYFRIITIHCNNRLSEYAVIQITAVHNSLSMITLWDERANELSWLNGW